MLALLLLCMPLASYAWWNDEWSFRKEITLDLSASGANLTGSATDVPVLIRLHLGNFGYFADTKPDGSDLRFVAADDKTPLKFHIERYDPTNQLAFVWVKVPQLAGGTNNTKLWMYYGNKSAPDGSESGSTYDAQQAAVLHLEGEGTPRDSTANNNNATVAAGQTNAASLIGGGVKLAGDGAINVPDSASLRMTRARGGTLSAWVRIESSQSDATLLRLGGADTGIRLGIVGTKAVVQVDRGGQPIANAQSSDLIVAGQWHHLAATAANDRVVLFVDGVEVASSPVELPDLGGGLWIGGSSDTAQLLSADIDEIQISNAARSNDWLKVAVASEGMDSKLVAYGNDSQKEGGDVSYFAITMKNVTMDGWVVIIICIVMLVIALLIMIAKAVMLVRVKSANAAFLKEFDRLKGDVTALDRDEDKEEEGDAALDSSPFMPAFKGEENRFRLSTLYRLYHHGVQEMTHRVGLRSAGARAVNALSPQAIEAIRAAMDATLVRMTQKLQAKMVLLTIAISGGPFLGLLGTVVGVMITFAAIAASGDVNVNSIAPGIAAALAATVAGLAVAIPALFGYNWLNTQIKEINADMHVFVDEFVTRVAEHYS